jgi:hypothetical protein
MHNLHRCGLILSAEGNLWETYVYTGTYYEIGSLNVNRFWELNRGVVSMPGRYSTASELALETNQFLFSACRGKAAGSEEDLSTVSSAVVKNM